MHENRTRLFDYSDPDHKLFITNQRSFNACLKTNFVKEKKNVEFAEVYGKCEKVSDIVVPPLTNKYVLVNRFLNIISGSGPRIRNPELRIRIRVSN
jgi:hypothetical protein